MRKWLVLRAGLPRGVVFFSSRPEQRGLLTKTTRERRVVVQSKTYQLLLYRILGTVPPVLNHEAIN